MQIGVDVPLLICKMFQAAAWVGRSHPHLCAAALALVLNRTLLYGANANDRKLDTQKALVESLQFKSDSARGVNLDEEMADLLVYEQAFAAAARVLAVIQNMIDALDRAIQ